MAANSSLNKTTLLLAGGVTGFTQGIKANASASANQTLIPPTSIGTVGQALTIASISSPNVTLGYSTVNTSASPSFVAFPITANHTVTVGDIGSATGFVVTQTGLGSFTLSILDSIASSFPNFTFYVMNNSTAATTNTLIVGTTLKGSLTLNALSRGDMAIFNSDGTHWYVTISAL